MLSEQITNQTTNFQEKDFNQLPFSLTDLLPSFVTETTQNAAAESVSLEVQQPKEIPNQEKDKTIVILNFILREVLPIKDRNQQKDLLVYFFRSILSETQRLPVTHLAYEITKKQNGELALHDDIYLLRPDLLQICQEAVNSLAISQTEKARYSLEKKQIEDLLATLENLFQLAPHAVLTLLANNQEKPLDQSDLAQETKTKLQTTGWQTLTPSQAFDFIQPEVKEKMKLENLAGEITVGPKFLYIMPQSAVHEGNLSIIVIAQPVFIPQLNRFILLHDQHLAPKDWQDHQQLFKKLGEPVPDNFSSLDFLTKEQLVMEKLVTLPKELQTTSASETFLELFPEKKFLKRLRQKLTRNKIKKMEQSLAEYAELTLDVVQQEVLADPDLRPATVTKLGNFMKRIIFAGILDVKKISAKTRQSLFKHFKNFGNLAESQFALSLQGMGFSSAVKAFDTSLLECVALSPLSSVQQLANLQLKGLDASSLTKLDLAKFVGEKRVNDWKMGSCVRCGINNTWVGECDWCLNCETSYNSGSKPGLASVSKTTTPIFKAPTKNSPKTETIFSETFGSFIANLI